MPMLTPLVIVLDIHERYLQHRGLWRALSLRKPNQELVPNHPDADIIDYLNHYIVEVEVPGIKDVSKLQVTWLDANTLVVRGTIQRFRPRQDAIDTANHHPGKTDAHEGIVEPWETEKLNGEDGQKEHHHRPYEVVQERRLGSFERHFWFPHATVKVWKSFLS